jgi:hypothetical protein
MDWYLKMRFARFAAVTAIVFAGTNLPFVVGRIPEHKSAPACIVGMTNWLWIAQGQHRPVVEHFSFWRLMVEVSIAVCAAWALSKAPRLAQAPFR